MIGSTSRYSTAITQVVTGPQNDTRQEMRVPFPVSRFLSFTYYRIQGSERIDQIANQYFGDGTRWWMIADANPEVMDWFNLIPGYVIRIPNG